MTEFKLLDEPQVYKFEYDFDELADAEAVAGCNLLGAFISGALNRATAVQLRGLVYALLKKNHPKVLLTEAAALLTKDFKAVVLNLSEEINAQFDDEQEPAEPPAENA